MTDFGNTMRPVARKEYKCAWCLGPILRGEQHVHFVGKWEGEFQNWRMHNECEEDADDNDALREGFTDGDGTMPPRVLAICRERDEKDLLLA